LTRTRDTLSDIARLLAPRPGQLELANRLALICAVTVLVAEIYQTPEPALTAYVAFFLNRDNRTMSLIIDLLFVALITFIIGFILLVAMVVINDPMWRVISMALILFCLLFLGSASKLRPVAGIIALIVGYALDLLGTLQQVAELGTRGLLYAWLFVGIPAGISILVNLLLGPSPRRLAERAIGRRLELSVAMLQMPDGRIRREFRARLREGAEIEEWLGLTDREKTSAPGDIAALRQAAYSTVTLMSAIDVIDRQPGIWLPMPLREYLTRTLHEMAAVSNPVVI